MGICSSFQWRPKSWDNRLSQVNEVLLIPTQVDYVGKAVNIFEVVTEANPSRLSNNACILTYTGHTNEKIVVKFSVMDGYIACGSEINYWSKNSYNILYVTDCPATDSGDGPFNFGIYSSALTSRIIASRKFVQKYFYCLWWGLQTTKYVGEVVFSIGYNNKTSFLVGISLAQVGEFAFVLLSRASNLHLVDGKLYLLLLRTTTLSLVTTPLLFKMIPSIVHLGVLMHWFAPDGSLSEVISPMV